MVDPPIDSGMPGEQAKKKQAVWTTHCLQNRRLAERRRRGGDGKEPSVRRLFPDALGAVYRVYIANTYFYYSLLTVLQVDAWIPGWLGNQLIKLSFKLNQ